MSMHALSVMTLCNYAGKIKTHNLGYQETDTVQAVFNKELCSSRLRLQAK